MNTIARPRRVTQVAAIGGGGCSWSSSWPGCCSVWPHRVVSYTLITALLGGVYVGLIAAATRLLPFRSAVAVAASTLVTAALFNPLRRCVQHVVDRRFNRSRYNAEALVAGVSAAPPPPWSQP